jgi:hypothetical protein
MSAINPEYVSVGFGLGMPLLTYLYFFIASRPRWISAKPRPQEGDEPVLPQKVSPALAGLFLDGRVGEEAVAATIVELITHGFIGLLDKGDKVVLIKQKSLDDLPVFEQTIAEHLLSKGTVVKSELEIARRINRQLYDAHLSAALRSLYQEGVAHRYFFEDPNVRYAWYYFVGLVIFFLGLLAFGLLVPMFTDAPTVLFFPLGLIVTGTTIISRAKTASALSKSGRLIQEVWHDYRQELIHFQPGKRPDVYFTFLPYAFALGVEKQWTERWKDEVFERPEWFTSFSAPSREEFLKKLATVCRGLARDLYALRDPALKD